MNIVLTGATGFIGQKLLARLALDHHTSVALVRSLELASTLPCTPLIWDSDSVLTEEALSKISDAQAWIHLAGEPVAGQRWNEAVKKRIYSSRVDGTRRLVDALERLQPDQRPKVLISGSAIGFYGNRADEVLNESSSAGEGFLASVVKDWEAEARRAESLGVRVVLLRIGIVLGLGGGALQKMQPVILGSGRQWMSWVHVDDVVSFVAYALQDESIRGVYNLCSPQPETNAAFTRHYAKAIGASLVLKAPKSAIKLALGEMSSIVLDGARVLPERASQAGFSFQFTSLSEALTELFPAPLQRRLSTTQFVPKPIGAVFSFFSRAENLEEITPPWLNFRILGTSTPQMQTGTLIDYKLKIHGFPVRWQSRISDWEPQKKFVDSQVKGPYKKWHHTHFFEEVPGGTLIRDEVIYKLPVGKLGSLAGGALVKHDVEEIFSYRRKKIAEIFRR